MQASNTRFHKEINCVEGKALLINVKTGEDVAFRVTQRLASNCSISSKVKKWVSSRVKSQDLLQNVYKDKRTNGILKKKLFEDVTLSTSGLKKCSVGT